MFSMPLSKEGVRISIYGAGQLRLVALILTLLLRASATRHWSRNTRQQCKQDFKKFKEKFTDNVLKNEVFFHFQFFFVADFRG